MNKDAKKNGANVFAAAFAEALSDVLTESADSPWPLELMPCGAVPTTKGTPIHFRLTLTEGLCGECFIEFSEPQAVVLLAQMLHGPVDEVAEEHKETLAKALLQAAEKAAASLQDKFGPVNVKVDPVAGLAFGGMFVVPIAACDSGTEMQVLLFFGGQLLEALSAAYGNGEADGAEELVVSPRNLKLVMDVELNVSLRFGQRQLPLRDVLDLGSGSIVELDRMVDDPVELYLDGKLIARGEAVVVDGNYGLRVTEIPQPIANHFLN
jgi:flagellar motor switch protein FliN/FliY